MSFLYDAAFLIFGAAYLPFFLRRLKEEKDKRRLLRERLGRFSPEFVARLKGKKIVWVHAVSVGEVHAARPLVRELEKRLPGREIVLSTVTPTGQATAMKFFPEHAVFYFPFDVSGIVQRALEALSPELILLVETEIWPNLVLEADRRNVPVGIVNGRLSPRSYSRYRLIRSFLRKILEKISFFLVQFPADKERFIALGARPGAVADTGNMKFDWVEEKISPAMGLWRGKADEKKGRILVAGSTHPGEEALLAEVFGKLRKEFSPLHLVIAPRHVRRADEIVKAMAGGPLSFERISLLKAVPRSFPDVLVLDVMGELKNWYSIADIVVIGGSFARHGGHNPIEAAVFAKPILTGPHVFNFQAVYEMFSAAESVAMVKNGETLYEDLHQLLRDPEACSMLGKKAFQVVKSFQGVTLRNADFVEKFLQGKGDARGALSASKS